MYNFKVGDRVVCTKDYFNSQVAEKFGIISRVSRTTSIVYLDLVDSKFTTAIADISDLVPESVYNSKLYKALK